VLHVFLGGSTIAQPADVVGDESGSRCLKVHLLLFGGFPKRLPPSGEERTEFFRCPSPARHGNLFVRPGVGFVSSTGRRSGVNRVATLIVGFVIGGAVVGGTIYLSDTQDDSTSGSLPAEDSPTPAPSGTGDPFASPTPTVAVATPVTEADELRIDGLGSMMIGMHVNDIERATGMAVDISSDFSPHCRYGQLVGGPHDLFLMFSRRVLVRIDVGNESAIETGTGIGIGDPISKVEDAYGDELQRELHPYLGDRGSYLIFDPEPEDGLLIIFETNRRSVTSFRSGFDQQVRYIEGCA
jgi:hypothetical protein